MDKDIRRQYARKRFMKLRKMYAIMDVRTYTKYLHEKHGDMINIFLENRGFYMDTQARESMLVELMTQVWRGVSTCIEHNVEVRFNKGTCHKKGTLLKICYAERPRD